MTTLIYACFSIIICVVSSKHKPWYKPLRKGYDESYAGPPKPCDPLTPQVCAYPFPNDYWLIKDKKGNPVHLAFTEETFPFDDEGNPINPSSWNKYDGFSPIDSILAYFDDLSIGNCARLWNIQTSLHPDAPIIILDPDTNQRIAYWTELDHASDTEFSPQQNRSLMIWPSHRLTDGKNYIIAFRDLQTNQGIKIEASAAFKALRDGISTKDPAIEKRRKRYNKYIFAKLKANGVCQSTLQLAWEFTVMSTKSITNPMVSMRDDAFSRIKDGNVEYTITEITEHPFDNMARKIIGNMKVPWYLSQREPGVNTRIVRNDKDWFGAPQYQGTEDVEFEVLIPNSLANGSMPNTQSRYLQYGHGLLGRKSQLENSNFRRQANQYGYILGGVDWIGLSKEDVLPIAEVILFNLTNFVIIPERCHQGMLNALFFMKLLLSPEFIADDIFKFLSPYKGNYYDIINVLSPPYKRNYYGNSQGGILGTVYMSLTSDVARGSLGVPGGPYSLLLPRSIDFTPFYETVKLRYSKDIDRIFIISIFQLVWNALEGSGYVNHINKNLFPNTPTHSVIYRYALSDAQVSWLGAHQLGRAADCVMYESQVPQGNETLYGFEFLDDSAIIDTKDTENAGKCLVEGWVYNVPPIPFTNTPPLKEFDTHSYPRREPQAIMANYKFWSEGIIINPCNGPCVGTVQVVRNRTIQVIEDIQNGIETVKGSSSSHSAKIQTIKAILKDDNNYAVYPNRGNVVNHLNIILCVAFGCIFIYIIVFAINKRKLVNKL